MVKRLARSDAFRDLTREAVPDLSRNNSTSAISNPSAEQPGAQKLPATLAKVYGLSRRHAFPSRTLGSYVLFQASICALSNYTRTLQNLCMSRLGSGQLYNQGLNVPRARDSHARIFAGQTGV